MGSDSLLVMHNTGRYSDKQQKVSHFWKMLNVLLRPSLLQYTSVRPSMTFISAPVPSNAKSIPATSVRPSTTFISAPIPNGATSIPATTPIPVPNLQLARVTQLGTQLAVDLAKDPQVWSRKGKVGQAGTPTPFSSGLTNITK